MQSCNSASLKKIHPLPPALGTARLGTTLPWLCPWGRSCRCQQQREEGKDPSGACDGHAAEANSTSTKESGAEALQLRPGYVTLGPSAESDVTFPAPVPGVDPAAS